jgi:hypothetical protein
MDAPTQCPDGRSLTRRALSECFDTDFVARAEEAYRQLRVVDAGQTRQLPRLETVLDAAVAEHGIGVLAELLADVVSPPPNSVHRFFASHLSAGGAHVTANFDTCIERSGGDAGQIIHFHGVVDSWDALGARLSVIEAGFSDDLARGLRALLAELEVLIVVGYSGLDYFDVDPFWRACCVEGLMAAKVVVWVDHEAAGWSDGEDPARPHRQLRWFRDGGAEVKVVRAPTRVVLGELAGYWSLPAPAGPPPPRAVADVTLELGSAAKQRATTRLFSTMGLHEAVRARLSGRALDREEHAWAAEAAWAAGQYREAVAHWDQATPGDDIESRAVRAERQAAVQWVRGSLRRAFADLMAALEAAERGGVPPKQRLIMAETAGRILTHMGRLPDTRVLATGRKRRKVVDHLDRAAGELGGESTVHLMARVESVRANLTGDTTYDPAETIDDLSQSEALAAMLNYRHHQLRQHAERGEPDVRDYLEHAADFDHIGDHADAIRVPLLPGAEVAFTPANVWRGFGDVDFTWWHRRRLFVSWVARRETTRLIRSARRWIAVVDSGRAT